jgi:hypothetical protein
VTDKAENAPEIAETPIIPESKVGDQEAPKAEVKGKGVEPLSDENGDAITFYHGTPTPGFSKFAISKEDNYEFGPGVSFTPDPTEAGRYASMGGENKRPGIYPARLRAKNPLEIELPIAWSEDLAKKLKDPKYDAIIAKDETGKIVEVRVRSNDQIESIFEGATTPPASVPAKGKSEAQAKWEKIKNRR